MADSILKIGTGVVTLQNSASDYKAPQKGEKNTGPRDTFVLAQLNTSGAVSQTSANAPEDSPDLKRIKGLSDDLLAIFGPQGTKGKYLTAELLKEFGDNLAAYHVNFVWLEGRKFPADVRFDFNLVPKSKEKNFRKVQVALLQAGAEETDVYGPAQINLANQKFQGILARLATEKPDLLSADDGNYFVNAVGKGQIRFEFIEGKPLPAVTHPMHELVLEVDSNGKTNQFNQLITQIREWSEEAGTAAKKLPSNR